MQRGAVVIGLDSYPDPRLHSLQAAVKGAHQIADWAERTGYEVKLLTDEAGPVTLESVERAITEFCSRTGSNTLDQLLVYFAGHGINKSYGEYWLLSGAPGAVNEAINLRSSVELARNKSGIRHVVFISDACRTAADSIDAQNVEGGVPFPNPAGDLRSDYVDRFFATVVGRAAQEVATVEDAVAAYGAIYTDCLMSALKGEVPALIEALNEDGAEVGVVTPRALKPFLKEELPLRVAALKLPRAQEPDAIVESNYPLYLSRLPGVPPQAPQPPAGVMQRILPTPPLSLSDAAAARVREILHSYQEADTPADLLGIGAAPDSALMLFRDELAVSRVVGRSQFESRCGFSVVGASIRRAFASGATCDITIDDQGNSHVRVTPTSSRARLGSILIEFDRGSACLLAVLPEYVGTLVVDRDELANVSYEPSRNSPRWPDHAMSLEGLRVLRAAVAAASRNGVFRIQGDASLFAERIRVMKGVDPTLGVYAAYAYDDAGRRDEVRSIARYMRKDLDTTLFDVEMLGRSQTARLRRNIRPCCPMLSQGWPLLMGKGVTLPGPVNEARHHLRPSLWTLFDSEGAEILRLAMQEGRLR